MAETFSIDQEARLFTEMVDRALRDRVRAALKEPLMKMAEAEVDKAVDVALAGLKTAIQSSVELARDRRVIEVLVRRIAPDDLMKAKENADG